MSTNINEEREGHSIIVEIDRNRLYDFMAWSFLIGQKQQELDKVTRELATLKKQFEAEQQKKNKI